jgi:maltose O-acetyltransferase
VPDVRRSLDVLRRELAPPRPRLVATSIVSRLLPDFSFVSVRSQLLRWCGWQLGDGAVLFGGPRWYGPGPIHRRLVVGSDVRINIGCRIELAEHVTIGDGAALGHEVLVLTSSHRIGRRDRRAGPEEAAPVTIGAGAWLGARCVILPGVTVGEGALVTAGSVVNKDVPPNCVVGGVPASVLVPRLPG